jgi:hypothetical protein
MAGRLGVVLSDIYRMEIAEARGAIELNTLRRAAEALGCELVYGLTPKEGMLAQMAATLEAGRAQKRAEGYERKLEKGRAQRRAAAEKRWHQQQRDAHAEEWRRYREAWNVEVPCTQRRRPPKILRESPWWKEAMRKEFKKSLRKAGIRLR